MLKVTQDISSIDIMDVFQIKGCNSEDTLTLPSDSDNTLKKSRPKLNMLKNSLSYFSTLI